MQSTGLPPRCAFRQLVTCHVSHSLTYLLTFLLQVLVAIVVGVGSIAFLRKRQRVRAAELRASFVAPIGNEVAVEFASYLEQGLVLCYRHRDGCGVGVRFAEGTFVYGHASEGDLPTSSEFIAQGWCDSERREFPSHDEFVLWLAAHSSRSLSAEGDHQRLTKDRIEKAIEYCRQNSSSNWACYHG